MRWGILPTRVLWGSAPFTVCSTPFFWGRPLGEDDPDIGAFFRAFNSRNPVIGIFSTFHSPSHSEPTSKCIVASFFFLIFPYFPFTFSTCEFIPLSFAVNLYYAPRSYGPLTLLFILLISILSFL